MMKLTKLPLYRYRLRLLAVVITAAFFLTPTLTPKLADDLVISAQRSKARHIGYGISIAPHLTSQADLVAQMGMDWVLLYDTSQIPDYPNQHIIYRVDFPAWSGDYNAWVAGLPQLATVLSLNGVDAV